MMFSEFDAAALQPPAGAFFERAITLLEQRAAVKNIFLGIYPEMGLPVDNVRNITHFHRLTEDRLPDAMKKRAIGDAATRLARVHRSHALLIDAGSHTPIVRRNALLIAGRG